jgi:transposase InsO family protein
LATHCSSRSPSQHRTLHFIIYPAVPAGRWSPRRHGRVRDELLNIEEFTSLTVAQVVIQTWRIEDNTYRPHSALDGLTPAEYAATWTPTTQPALSQ